LIIYLTHRDAPISNSPAEITVVPGREHMLNTVNFDGSQPKTMAPALRITMAMSVLNTRKDSITGTAVTRQRHDSFVAETITGCRDKPVEPCGFTPFLSFAPDF
jgi:hypothetical protein